MNFLIVGQGLAGTTLGFRLEQAGHGVRYVDAPEQTAASAVAAGIVNPITGRRFVKSWRIDELLPAAKTLYGELEALLGVRLYYDLPLLRTLYNRGDVNDWEVRSADPGYAEYMDDDPRPEVLHEVTRPVFAYGGVRHAGRVDVAALVNKFRERIRDEGRFTAEAFDWATVPELLKRYEGVIACGGWRARFNPWWAYLPHGGNKGEVLIVRTARPVPRLLFKHRVFLVPYGERTYWVGATSDNQFGHEQPTAANGDYLRQRLAEVLTIPYEVVTHRAAVRPTVKDRRPFLGEHPALKGLYIFNGLGTKGASLAPLTSKWLADHVLHGNSLPEEVDVKRWGRNDESPAVG